MKYTEAKQGRAFIVRLEDGEILHVEIEKLARQERIRAAIVIAVGAADEGSRLVVGPADRATRPVLPMEHALGGVSEVAGVGTIIPNEAGDPILHMHVACGRKKATVTGCVRRGVKTWQVLEVVVIELLTATARRVPDPATGFEPLQP